MIMGSIPNLARRHGTAEGVAASSQFNIKLPVGLTYEAVYLVMSGITHAQVTDIKVRINGGEIMSFRSGTELELLNSFQDAEYTSVAGTLCFDFRRLGVRDPEGRDISVIGTGVAAPQGEVAVSLFEITGTLAAGVTSPTITPYAILREPQTLGVIRHIRPFRVTPSGTGFFEISDLVRGRAIEFIAFKNDVGIFNEVVLEVNSNVYYEGPIALHTRRQNDGVRATQTGWHVLDFNPNGDRGNWLDVRAASDVRLKLNMTTAGAVDFTVCTLGKLAA